MKFKKYLEEETLGQAIDNADSKQEEKNLEKAEQVLGPRTEVEDETGDMEIALTKALKQALRAKKHGTQNWVNVLFIGLAGVAKTGRIMYWCKQHGVNLVTKSAASMDAGDVGGALAPDMKTMRAVKLGTSEMDELDEKPSILFLDELNRAHKDVRGTLLTLIQNHTIPDPSSPGSQRYLRNFLFTVAAINPSDSDLQTMSRKFGWDYNPEDGESFEVNTLDDAERSRFISKYVNASPMETYKYLKRTYEGMLEDAKDDGDQEEITEYTNKLNLAKQILLNRKFSFDSPADIRDSKESGNGLILNA